MLKIIEHGCHKRLLNVRTFKCEKCDCVFKCDKKYRYGTRSLDAKGWQPNAFWADCPECKGVSRELERSEAP